MGSNSTDGSRPGSRIVGAAVPWLVVALLAGVGFWSTVPPSARAGDTPAGEFAAGRARTHIEAIAGGPHPMGSPAIADVRSYLATELRKLGLQPEFQTLTVGDFYDPGGRPVDVVNLGAKIPGSASTGTIVLMAHYDTVPLTPGANDNTAAVATLLEVARALAATPQLANDVLLLFTDGEEPFPRYGSTAFVNDNPAFEDTAMVVNLEAVGSSGTSTVVEVSGSEGWMVRQYAAAVPNPAAYSFIAATSALFGDVGTDFDPFRNAGIPGFHFAYMRGSPIYHTPADDLESVGWDSVQHHGSNALGVARHFGDLDLGSVHESGPAVYFTLRPFFVQHGSAASIAMAVAAALLLVLGTLRRRRDLAGSPGSVLRGTALAVLLLLVGTALATVTWIGITMVQSAPAPLESLLYFTGIVAIGGVGVAWLHDRVPGIGLVAGPGFLALWVLLALITAFLAPAFSAIFALPSLAGSLALTWNPGGRRWVRVLRFAVVAVPTVILLVPVADFFFQLGQPRPGNPDSSMPPIAAVAFLFTCLGGGLLWSTWIQPGRAAPPVDRQEREILR